MENNKKFVIQKHRRGDDVHWDLMLETADALETYRLPVQPENLTAQPVEAVKILDHPLKFLTYQGSVNKGRGTVKIADTGIYKILNKDDTRTDFEFHGKILNGKFTLTLIEQDRYEFWAAHPEYLS